MKLKHPEEGVNFFYRVTVSWANPLIKLATQRQLHGDDVWDLPPNQSVEHDSELFWKNYDKNCHLYIILLRMHASTLLCGGGFLFLFMLCQLAQPYFLGELLNFLQSKNDNIYIGVGYGIAMAGFGLLSSYCLSANLYITRRLGASVRSGLMNACYVHALRLSSSTKGNLGATQTTNLVGIDTEKVYLACQFFNYIWLGPVTVITAMLLLLPDVGVTVSLSTMFFLLLTMPIQFILANTIKNTRSTMIKLTDDRVRLTTEILQFIRIVKYYAWEAPMEKCIATVRRMEVDHLRKYIFLVNVLYEIMFLSIPLATLFLISVLIFGVQDSLNSIKIFRILAYINMTRFPVQLCGQGLKYLSDGWVGLDRLNNFFLLDTVGSGQQTHDSVSDIGITLANAAFEWDGFKLKDFNMITLKSNELIGIIGEVASGKSSLMLGLLGEMALTRGSCEVRGKIAYCAQTPWIQNLSLKDNILFGKPYRSDEYAACLDAAALRADLESLPQGDATEIGERGINLSGGQKARVAIARALYAAQDKAIFLMDDPLSAVDSSTGNQIFHQGVMGVLQDKLRLVALNSHMHLLRHFDRVLVLDAGEVKAFASPEELFETHGDLLRRLTGLESLAIAYPSPGMNSTQTIDKDAALALEGNTLLEESGRGDFIAEDPETFEEKEKTATAMGKLIVEEKRAVGWIKIICYLEYFSAFLLRQIDLKSDVYTTIHTRNFRSVLFVGTLAMLGFLFMYSAGQAARVTGDIYLVQWSLESNQAVTPISTYYYITFGFLIIISIVRCYIVINFYTQGIIAAPVDKFFDTHTLGTVINRFSRDQEAIDALVPDSLSQSLVNWPQLLSVLVLCIIASPYFVIFIVAICIGFYQVYIYYSSVSRDLKRLDAVSRSPVYATFAETLAGITTIRAFDDTQRFRDLMMAQMSTNQKFYFHTWMCQSWMTFRLELASGLIVLFMSLIAVGLRGVVSETSLGLALAYSMQLTALFQRCVQLTVDLSSAMTSTERVLEFLEVEHESNIVFIDKTSQRGENAGDVEEETHDDVKDLVVSAASNCWPSSGVIEFRNVEMCYRDNPPVLRGVSFSTRSGERIGIAGRTGSGKSSLMVALFRIVELSRGAIFIDGRDVSAIPLHELRSHMSIITQDAVIFTGTLRFQLDPFDDHSDLEVWEVLERVNLAEFVRQLPDKLLESVSGSGEVLSQGQKQLICIARALIKRTKLLIMDEATSSIDVHTDAIIQSFLEVEVRQRQLTVLTIAHRLKTILNYDRILVLAEGKVIEFASPEELLQDSRSAFYSMAHQFEST